MGGIAIIDLNQSHNAASSSEYGAIYRALGGNNGQQSLTSRYVVINGGGEAIGYSTQLGTLWTPQTVANRIKHQGIIWVDYCGFPFFYQVSAAGVSQTLGQSGWRQFASYLGYGWLAAATFFVPISANYGFNAYPLPRGFPLNESLDGVCYDPTGSYTLPPGLFGIGGGTDPLTARGYTALFALHPPNGGYYFYATYVPPFINPSAPTNTGVDTATVNTFIRNILSGNTGAYACQPYQIATQVNTQRTSGPSSPVIITTPRTTPKTTPVAGRTPIVSAGTAKTTSSAVVEDLLIGGTVVTGLGLVTVALLRHHQRTRR